MILLQHCDVELYRLANVADGFLPRQPLAYAARQTQAFRHPVPIFAFVNHCLSHLHL